ncbi:hypothetical protein HN018_03780 [Lichenicola cladoniae]|uniref:Cation/H+ exchanger transmembrane domain-containing protein n=1 Tax=Lichenicola cladoniae TaxID=1484109 RepID=A0A6M8HLQ8_9PROT|nr:cation:proton antiporter [Lichenicola cladoniae]NPD70165.1 hypothetical protein [Acetobacteraceae bacterium]QKE89270.1 hypothetical protein HN018_03780 [Lichenicola cladoniae]
MALFELVIALLLIGALLAAWSSRVGLPYPALLALAGSAAAFIPGIPIMALDPRLALVLFVAPTLLDSAYDASPRDIRANWLPISALAVIVVLLTVIAVAWVGHAMVPGMPWAAAVALGAIVAPSDASAATAILRYLRPPHRLLVIIQGESLLNDAVSLIIYRIAVTAAVTGGSVGWTVMPQFLFTVGGGGLLGWTLARLLLMTPTHRLEIPIAVLVQFLSTFAVWLLADRLGVSAIITVVVYAVVIARHVPLRDGARRRIASYAVWDVAVFVLNVLAFLLIGLQLRAIVSRMSGQIALYVEVAGVVLLVVILVRLVWVMGYNAILRWALHRLGPRSGRQPARPTAGGGLIIAWCGMRGIVTLATALALPDTFIDRDIIIFCALSVVLGTLMLQGMTLRPLMQRLRLPEDNLVQEETVLARRETAQAAVAFLRNVTVSDNAALLLDEYATRAEGVAQLDGREDTLAGLQGKAVVVQRQRLAVLRRDGVIGDDAFHAIEEELDIIELTADPRIRATAAPLPHVD